MTKRYAITVDVDWAPDFMLDALYRMFVECKVASTWFVTHKSNFVTEVISKNNLFKLGMHPNFYPNSTHGNNVQEVLAHCNELVPGTTFNRFHGLYQSSRIIDEMLRVTNVNYDTSIFLPCCPNIEPNKYQRGDIELWRIPYYWEDDYAMGVEGNSDTGKLWSVQDLVENGTGVKIFNFHPIHVYLNSEDISLYNKLKEKHSDIKSLTANDVLGYRNMSKMNGVRIFLENLIDVVGANNFVRSLEELVA